MLDKVTKYWLKSKEWFFLIPSRVSSENVCCSKTKHDFNKKLVKRLAKRNKKYINAKSLRQLFTSYSVTLILPGLKRCGDRYYWDNFSEYLVLESFLVFKLKI